MKHFLLQVLKTHKLSKHYFKRLVQARYAKIETPTFADVPAVEKYAENAFSSIYYLLLEAQNTKDINTDHFASHLGKAHGIITLIRAIPHYAQRNIINLPRDLLTRHKVSLKPVFKGEANKEFKDVVFEVSSFANSHLQKVRLFHINDIKSILNILLFELYNFINIFNLLQARSLKDKVHKSNNVIFMPFMIVETYLESLRRIDFNVFDPNLQKKDNLLPAKLCWRKILNKLC